MPLAQLSYIYWLIHFKENFSMEFLESKLSLLQPEKYFSARGYIRLDTTKEWESVKHYLTASKRNENKNWQDGEKLGYVQYCISVKFWYFLEEKSWILWEILRLI